MQLERGTYIKVRFTGDHTIILLKFTTVSSQRSGNMSWLPFANVSFATLLWYGVMIDTHKLIMRPRRDYLKKGTLTGQQLSNKYASVLFLNSEYPQS